MRKLVLVMGLVVVAFACSDTVGGVLEDAGTMLQDGGAHAQDPAAHNVVCDKVRVTTTKSHDRDGVLTATITQRQEYAVLEVPDFRQVGVEHCQTPAQDTWVTCPPSDERNERSCTGLVQEQGCSYFIGSYHRGNTLYLWCDSSTAVDYVDPGTLRIPLDLGTRSGVM